MDNKQQTAVEWFIQELQKTRDYQRVINQANQSTSAVRDVVEQAKEMEKQQRAIELPSEEEVEKFINTLPFTKGLDDGQYNDGVIYGAIIGIDWMRNKIQEGKR
jgi:hypothetical protein